MEQDIAQGNISESEQLKKYASDLAKIYKSEKEKRKKLEAAYEKLQEYSDTLKKSEQRYKTLFNSAGDAIFIHNPAGRLKDVNQAACDCFGYKREELLQMNMTDIESPVFAESIPGRNKEIRQQKQVIFETAYMRKNGSFIPVEASSCLTAYDDETSVLTIARDISERKKAEKDNKELRDRLQQAHKMETVGTLAAGIAHDLNNILFPVFGFAEMALDDVPENSEVYDNLKQLLKAAGRGRDMVRQILAFSRKSEQKPRPFQFGLIITETLKLLKAVLPSKVRIRRDITNKPLWVLADPTKIHQVIMNLCTNAVHAMSNQDGLLEIFLDQADSFPDDTFSGRVPAGLKQGDYLRLRIKDTGHGMEPGILERIFEPYFTTKKQGRGTGMGLSVVYGIIKGYGGEIIAESTPDFGSTFTVFLPLIDPETAGQETGSAETALTGRDHILLVDDEQMIADMLKQMLEKLGYRVTALTRSKDAFETFKAQPDFFDLLITDQDMPDMTGSELAGQIINIRPDVPVIICSGLNEKITLDQAGKSGIRMHLEKPVKRQQLAEAIRQVLDQDKKHILVIDDDSHIRLVLRLMLERCGYEVTEASDGMEGISCYRQNPADLVITDIIMPEKRGIDMIYELRQEFPQVKIIAISGGGDIGPEVSLEVAENLGALRTFAKPLEQEDLLKAVRELLM